MRTTAITRNTSETQITLALNLDGRGGSNIDTGCGFLDHMLELFARHGRFDLDIKCRGDLHVDAHHTTEDIAIVLGRAFSDALGDRRGIIRYGSIILPMDEALILVSLDVSGRGMLCFNANFKTEKIGTFDTQLVEVFFIAFSTNSGINQNRPKLKPVNVGK